MLTDWATYREGVRSDGAPAAFAPQLGHRGEFTWLALSEPTLDELRSAVSAFEIHELVAEDLHHGNQRTKLEDYGDHEFLVVKTLHYDDPSSQVSTGELAVCVGPSFILTVQQGNGADLSAVHRRLEADPGRLMLGPYAVLHSLLDTIVDQSLQIAIELENDVAAIEALVFSDGTSNHTEQLYFLKREVIEFRRAIEPMRVVLERLVGDTELGVPLEVRHFFRDVSDHAQRAAEQVATLDALLAAAMSAHLTQVQLRQNEDVRKISAWAALAAIPTMLAGVYGMNFDNMPELHATWGYPAVVSVMVGCSFFLYRKFKRSGWL